MAIFNNQATLSYNGNIINSNTVTGNIVEVLSITKTAIGDTYTANDDVTYVISVTNAGTTAYTDLTITDDLGAYEFGGATLYPLEYTEGTAQYYINGVLTTSPIPTSLTPLTFAGLTVPAGGNAILIYEARANEFAPLSAGSSITNTVTASDSTLSNPITAEETITTLDEPVLSITKSLSPLIVTENGTITYTFTIQNTGNTPAIATDDVVITDTFDPILSDISVTIDGTPTTAYTYDETTGVFTTNAGAITVPAATYSQDPTTGAFIITPGVTVVTVTGTV